MTSSPLRESSTSSRDSTGLDPVAANLQTWLCKYVAQILNVAPNQIDPDVKFDRHGLDSSAAVGLVGDLSSWLECELDPVLTYDFPTVTDLSTELASREEIRSSLRKLGLV
jgi:acyl carrier protein